MTVRLLLLSCSAAKRHHPARMPAIERYDGPSFRVLRKALAADAVTPETRIRIVSAEHGLLGPFDPIRDYDRHMTVMRAQELAPIITGELLAWFLRHPDCQSVFVNLGRSYLPAIAGLLEWCAHHEIPCTLAAGRIGQRTAQLRAWLRAEEL